MNVLTVIIQIFVATNLVLVLLLVIDHGSDAPALKGRKVELRRNVGEGGGRAFKIDTNSNDQMNKTEVLLVPKLHLGTHSGLEAELFPARPSDEVQLREPAPFPSSTWERGAVE